MKKFLKSAYSNTINLIQTLISVASVVLFSSFVAARKFKKLVKLSGEQNECYVMGNGASLKKVLEEEIEMFLGKDVFTVNLFYETPYFEKLKPKNHIIADGGFWEQTVDQRILGIQNRFKDCLMKVTWKMNLLLPYDGLDILGKVLKENQNITLIPYNRTPVSGYQSISHFLYKRNLGMPKPTNVLNAALFLSLNLGYNKVNLYGADHSWISDLFVDENNNVCCYDNHFYDQKRSYSVMARGSLAVGLQSIVEAFSSYELLEDYSKKLNVKIVNRTKGSFIDVFDRG